MMYLPSSTSTPDEIRRGAIKHGLFVLEHLADIDFASLIQCVEQIAREYNKEEWYGAAHALQVSGDALKALDACEPPIPYPYYFCTPDTLVQHPQLVTYYRNVAMISQKAMRDWGLNTAAYEAGQIPTPDVATDLARCFNRVISALVTTGGVTPQRHLEMAYINVGADLGELQQTD
jgi:hypothetical protein